MKSIFLNISLFFLCFSYVSFAQKKESEHGDDQNNPLLIYSKENTMNLVSSTAKNQINMIIRNNQQSDVTIQQIGASNFIESKLKADDINVSIIQNGSKNQLLLNKNANEISQKIVQEGQYNSITDFSLYANYNVNMEIIQKGDNQSVQNFGTNSLSKNMKITQFGNGASVIILNK